MKKQTNIKGLSAVFVMAVSMFFVNIHAQDVVLEFTSPVEGGVGSEASGGGIGGDGPAGADFTDFVEAEDPRVEFNFTIGPTGQLDLDVVTASTVPLVIDALNSWDGIAIANITNEALHSKSFSLVLRGESRMQLGYNGGDGIGVRGKNQGRLDDVGDNTEWLEFTLTGDVGIDFVRLGYTDVGGDAVPHLIIKDHDTDSLHSISGDPDPGFIDATDVYNMRYFSDILHFTTADTGANGGCRIYSLEFDIVPSEPKPPAVTETIPVHADTTVETTADYVMRFDVPMDPTSTEGAITFTPAISNAAYSWNTEGTELTISHDQLPYSTEYIVEITTDASGTNSLGMLADTTFTFKTLPEPPNVPYTFPANLAANVPVTTPFEIQFSKGMITDSVEKAFEFTPAVDGLDFIWNEDNSTVYFSTDELSPSTQYFVTIGTVATDRFGVQMAAPFQFVFTTANPVGVDNRNVAEMVVYPNPADDILSIRGVDVKTVRIYSMTGQLVREINETPVFGVNDLKPGSYVITVLDRNEKLHKNIVMIK